VNEQSAYENEMGFPHALRDHEVERLLSRQATDGDGSGLEDVVLFLRALQSLVPQAPDPRSERDLVRKLADTARAGSATAAPILGGRRTARARRGRRATVALGRIALAAMLLAVALAGLAFAGVRLPGPVNDAFSTVGVDLPNQAGDEGSSATTPGSSEDVNGPSDQGSAAGGKGSAADHRAGSHSASRGKGQTTRRSHRKAYGPSRSAQPNPPGDAVRRGPNPTPGVSRGELDIVPSGGGGSGSGSGSGNATTRGSSSTHVGSVRGQGLSHDNAG
jgi:hypothetical protein